jgi:peptide/nickel transport system substrate-binding protein
MKQLIVCGLLLGVVTLGWGNPGVQEQAPEPRGEVRIVDPHYYNWASVVMNIFEHLIEPDKGGTLVPCLATDWHWLDNRTLEMTLRRGVTFHNGEVFDAAIVKLNWDENLRLKQPFVPGEFMNFKAGARLEIIDPYTIRLGALADS